MIQPFPSFFYHGVKNWCKYNSMIILSTSMKLCLKMISMSWAEKIKISITKAGDLLKQHISGELLLVDLLQLSKTHENWLHKLLLFAWCIKSYLMTSYMYIQASFISGKSFFYLYFNHLNRPFTTNNHMVQNPPCWRASSSLFPHWDVKTKAGQAWLVEDSLL